MNTATQFPPIIITGGAAGIGYALAEAFVHAGYPVAIIDLAKNSAAAADRLAAKAGVKAIGLVADVTDPVACLAAHAEIVAALGPIGVLINNAGTLVPQKGWVEEIPNQDYQQIMAVHVDGAVNWCRLVMPNMRSAKFGRIINISSANGVKAVPHRFAYVTAKKALLGLTEALALDCARAGITVNAIAPGYILTDRLKERVGQGMINHEAIAEHTPVGRWGQTEDIAHMALFLANPASSYITGTTMCVDGGLTIRGDPGEDINFSPFAPFHPNNNEAFPPQ